MSPNHDQLEVLRSLIASVQATLDELKSSLMSADSNMRVDLDDARRRILILESDLAELRRAQSDDRKLHREQLDAAIAHLKKSEEARAVEGADMTKRLDQLTEATSAIVKELGINGSVELGPPVDPHNPPQPPLQALATNVKTSKIVLWGIAVSYVVKTVLETLLPHIFK